jgi:carboxypeptidase C (cathepsin A)
MYSKGPFTFIEYDKTILPNNFRWNKQANVLFIEGPGGVGFSADFSGINKNISDQ